MKIRKIIQQIREELSKGVPSDDNRYSNRFIYNRILSVRSQLLMQKANAKQPISNEDITVICMDTEEVNGFECCGYIGTCKVIRGNKKLPQIIQSLYGPMIKSISSSDYKRKINLIDINQVSYIDDMEYSKNIAKAVISDDYLYIIGKNIPKKIRVLAVVNDPLEVEMCDNENNCISYLDRDLPIQSGILENLIQLTINQIKQAVNNEREDKKGDTMSKEME